MKIQNTSDYPTPMLRKMIAWICKQHGMPAKWLKNVKATKTNWWYRGRAWHSRILIRINKKQAGYPKEHTYGGRSAENGWPVIQMNDAIDALVMIAAHEIFHVMENHTGKFKYSGSDRTKTEKRTEWETKRVLKIFQDNREQLLAEWMPAKTPVPVTVVYPVPAAAADFAPPTNAVVIKLRDKAKAMLEKWMRKMRMAKTKVAKYQRQVLYYEKKLGAPS